MLGANLASAGALGHAAGRLRGVGGRGEDDVFGGRGIRVGSGVGGGVGRVVTAASEHEEPCEDEAK